MSVIAEWMRSQIKNIGHLAALVLLLQFYVVCKYTSAHCYI
ncbi:MULTISPECIES: hypothetical protein [unclassified Okeania]|nr:MULTISPECIES: hypothetical protein [unclassified Okeania]